MAESEKTLELSIFFFHTNAGSILSETIRVLLNMLLGDFTTVDGYAPKKAKKYIKENHGKSTIYTLHLSFIFSLGKYGQSSPTSQRSALCLEANGGIPQLG